MSWRWFPWHPINLEVFFSDILATTSRLNSLYGLETFVQSSRHVWIMKKVLRHTQHFWRIFNVINVGFVSHFAVFGYSKCHKVCTNSWFSHGIYILIGSTTVPSLMCKWLNYDIIIVKKVPFPVQACLDWRTFSSTCSTFQIIMKFYQQIRSMKRSRLAKF